MASNDKLKSPSKLSRREKELWRKLVAAHPHLGEADLPLLTAYVQLHVTWQAAIDKVSQEGALATSKDGGEYLTGSAIVVTSLCHRLVRIARELKLRRCETITYRI